MVEFYLQISQSNTFNRKTLMVLFNRGRSHLMNKLCLIRNLICLGQGLEDQNDQWLLKNYTQVHDQLR